MSNTMEAMEAKIWTIVQTREGNTVLLKLIDSEIGIPIFVDPAEARTILIGYSEITALRPFIHDVILELVQQMGLELFRIEVHDIKNSIFYTRLFFSRKDEVEQYPLVLNSRPADALALAVRTKCPIQVSRKVVEQAGIPLKLFMEEIEDSGFDLLNMDGASFLYDKGDRGVSVKYQGLAAALDEALAAEEYERAAELRDILIFLEQEQGRDQGSKA